jgi:hypothetical protein
MASTQTCRSLIVATFITCICAFTGQTDHVTTFGAKQGTAAPLEQTDRLSRSDLVELRKKIDSLVSRADLGPLIARVTALEAEAKRTAKKTPKTESDSTPWELSLEAKTTPTTESDLLGSNSGSLKTRVTTNSVSRVWNGEISDRIWSAPTPGQMSKAQKRKRAMVDKMMAGLWTMDDSRSQDQDIYEARPKSLEDIPQVITACFS